MVRHKVDIDKCRGCGKCVESCGLELWQMKGIDGGKKVAEATDDAGEICHLCGSCREACPEKAILLEEA